MSRSITNITSRKSLRLVMVADSIELHLRSKSVSISLSGNIYARRSD
jgi:hypothetical protein